MNIPEGVVGRRKLIALLRDRLPEVIRGHKNQSRAIRIQLSCIRRPDGLLSSLHVWQEIAEIGQSLRVEPNRSLRFAFLPPGQQRLDQALVKSATWIGRKNAIEDVNLSSIAA